MWEAIASNKVKSRILISLMGVLLVVLGFVIGGSIDPRFAGLGALAAVFLWLILLIVAMVSGDDILLSSAGAHEITKEQAPQLWNVVEEMTIASGLGAMPHVLVIEDFAPNAFAVGRKKDRSAVAVTSGLLERLNRDELQGVVAHEIGHIVNQDTRFMTMAAVMLGSIVMISDVFLRSMYYGGRSRTSRSSGNGGGQAQLVMLVIALAMAVLAPIVARILYFACSRRREYLADASGALFTRYPEGLASALEKIALKASGMQNVNRAMAPMYIVNPLQGFSSSGLLSTHPATEERIQILRSMGGGAGYVDYENAFKKVAGSNCIGARTLSASTTVPARPPSPESEASADTPATEIGGLLDRLGKYTPIPCACGVTIKLPPDLHADSITCPRCGTKHAVPKAVASAPVDGASLPPLQYQRKSRQWESFRCECGQTLQVSPSFMGTHLHCPKCRREVEITGTP